MIWEHQDVLGQKFTQEKLTKLLTKFLNLTKFL